MFILGCAINGDLNQSKFSHPLPWIGVYVAIASAMCALAMAADVFHGLRQRKLWFRCKYFSLNATTLTLIAIATKFSVDLNTSMPRKQDQLAKLSSAAFMCTVMANSLPCIGTMQNKEILMSIMAMGILAITTIVNICIQLGTGVIYTFWNEQVILMFLMLVLLAMLCSSALAVPTTKSYLEKKYTKKHEIAIKECSDHTKKCTSAKLRGDLSKFWMMANTCGPQFVIIRSATGAASGLIGILSAATLAEATLRSIIMPRFIKFCNGDSDYKWSTSLVLVSQITAVVFGTIGPAFRWFTAINSRRWVKVINTSKQRFQVESYWIQILVDCKETPIEFNFCGCRGKKLAHQMKNVVLVLCIGFQIGVVTVSKMFQLISNLFMDWTLICYRLCRKTMWLVKQSCDNSAVDVDDSKMCLQPDSELHHLSRFVLHLEGEEEMVYLMMKDSRNTTDHWFSKGKNMQPENLLKFLGKFPSTQKLKGVYEFDSNQVPSLHAKEPPNCWALPLVTLTSIAIALPGIENRSIKQLVRSISEGLTFIRIVQNNLNNTRELINVTKAAEVLWLKVELYYRWLDTDLQEIALQNESPEKLLEQLVDIAKQKFLECKADVCEMENPSRWPVKALAANSMYRISRTILSNYHENSGEKLFKKLSIIIADILKSCLTNLPTVIPMECIRSTIEVREESVRHAIVLLGRADKILESLHEQTLPNLDPGKLGSIDEWRSLGQAKSSQLLSASVFDKSAYSTSDVYLSME